MPTPIPDQMHVHKGHQYTLVYTEYVCSYSILFKGYKYGYTQTHRQTDRNTCTHTHTLTRAHTHTHTIQVSTVVTDWQPLLTLGSSTTKSGRRFLWTINHEGIFSGSCSYNEQKMLSCYHLHILLCLLHNLFGNNSSQSYIVLTAIQGVLISDWFSRLLECLFWISTSVPKTIG